MASPLNETREPQWKKAWTGGSTLLSAPPLPVVAIVGVVVFLLWVSSHLNNNNHSDMQISTTNNVNLFLLFLPLALALIAQVTRLVLPAATRLHEGDAESSETSSSMPWGWIVSAVMLLVLISYRLHPIFVIALAFLYVYFLSA